MAHQRNGDPDPATSMRDPTFHDLQDHVLSETGLEYYRGRPAVLAERVSRRMAALGYADVGRYHALVSSPDGRGELEALIGELTVGESHFFRIREQFDFFRNHILPEARERSGGGPLRIWSAGCAAGPEPYSVAITVAETMVPSDRPVDIVGSDLNPAFLREARAATYGEWALRGLRKEERTRYFRRSGGSWSLDAGIRRRVRFVKHNLVRDPIPDPGRGLEGLDVVLCRNVLIYFSRPLMERILQDLHAALRPGGWLVLGHSEAAPELVREWEPSGFPGSSIVRRSGPEPSTPPPPPLPVPCGAIPTRARRARRPGPTPDDPSRKERLAEAVAMADRGDFADAASRFDALVRERAHDGRVRFLRALVDQHLGGDPLPELLMAARCTPAHPLLRYHAGVALVRADREQDARPHLEAALHLCEALPPLRELEDGDGLSAVELARLVRQRLDVLRETT
ncbi:MAG: protein-glutamate O-methyltransferase CheR [Longimicrobiales bacterium]